ncbi:hypothetical protein LUZ60_004757 [Juncus effusus]|nr:hypothetical protein LUZ60_004757 [Juncus effusus]
MEAIRIVVLMTVIGLAFSTFISDDVLNSNAHGSTGRSLLQMRNGCPINFESANYTIITSKCKGPLYPATLCCAAFKEFTCPYAVELNDLTTDCATTMFSYINLYGKYPPGLFASECRDDQQGLQCTEAMYSKKNSVSSFAGRNKVASGCLLFVFSILAFFFVGY